MRRRNHRQSVDQILQSVLALPEGERVYDPGAHRSRPQRRVQEGTGQARSRWFYSGAYRWRAAFLDEEIRLDKRRNHSIEAVIDRLLIKPGINRSTGESIRTALKLTNAPCWCR